MAEDPELRWSRRKKPEEAEVLSPERKSKYGGQKSNIQIKGQDETLNEGRIRR